MVRVLLYPVHIMSIPELSEDLYYAGIKKVTSIDISETVITQLKKKHTEDKPELKCTTKSPSNVSSSSMFLSMFLSCVHRRH